VKPAAGSGMRAGGSGMGTVMRRTAVALAAVAALATAAGCAAASAPAAGPAARVGADARSAVAVRAVARASARAKTAATCDPTAASLAPNGPPKVTPGSFMAKIRTQHYLIAGVDQSTYHFGFLNPLDSHIEGFDIDMIRAVAKAIFGDPNKVEYKAISDAQRMPDILNGSVDIVAHTMTITCARLQQVDFSSVYFEAHQRILVPSNSTVNSVAALAGQKVCVTKGSDSGGNLKLPSGSRQPIVVSVQYWTDCLVRLQQDQVAAISTDDSILDGLQAQDPFTKVVGPALTSEPYGLAISKQHPDFVRFVNAVLAQERSDGAWKTSYANWVATPGTLPPPPPVAHYAS
jgi:polar amino acid transport system substrate-binding protein